MERLQGPVGVREVLRRGASFDFAAGPPGASLTRRQALRLAGSGAAPPPESGRASSTSTRPWRAASITGALCAALGAYSMGSTFAGHRADTLVRAGCALHAGSVPAA